MTLTAENTHDFEEAFAAIQKLAADFEANKTHYLAKRRKSRNKSGRYQQ